MVEQTTEPGVRALEREIAKVLRKEAVRVVKAMGPASANPTADMTDWMKAPWYTPREVMAAIHEVLGPAELDPASPSRPYFVQTKRLYYEVEDGLVQSWRVADDNWLFLNPPWEEVRKWLAKLAEEMACGNVHRAVVLIPNKRSDAYDSLCENGAALINMGRLKFGGASSTSRDYTACFVVGYNNVKVDALLAAFHRHGIPKAKIDRYAAGI
jgi:DNA N-6-adenine-methyltransferase (Dam)